MRLIRLLIGIALATMAAQAQAVPCTRPYEAEELLAHAASYRVGFWSPRVRDCGVNVTWSNGYELRLRQALAERSALKNSETNKWINFVRQNARGAAQASSSDPPPGERRVVDGVARRWIPKGVFQMGCSPGDKECNLDESPAREVELTKGFWMAETETTVDHWRRVVRRMPEGTSLNPEWKNGNYPIVKVNWQESTVFCAQIGGRLPTEAEWERAARAGRSDARYGEITSIAWFARNSGGWMHDAGGLTANAWGLKDILGNVWEWTADWSDISYYDRNERKDPKGPATGEMRVVRGGSWLVDERVTRVSFRYRRAPADRDFDIGVRCVWD